MSWAMTIAARVVVGAVVLVVVVGAVVEIVHGRCRADGLIPCIDSRAHRSECEGLRRSAVVRQRRGEQRVGVAERGAGGGRTVGTGETARCAVINVMTAISDRCGAL